MERLRVILIAILRPFCGSVYPVRVRGAEHIAQGGALLLSNHNSYIDYVVLQLACRRPVRFLAFDAFHRYWWSGWAMRLFGVIPIAPGRAKDSLKRAAEHVRAGDLVCIFPEGEINRTGTLLEVKRGLEVIARLSGQPVVPVWIDSLWGSFFSFAGGGFFRKPLFSTRRPLRVAFGRPIPPGEATVERVREALLELSAETFCDRPQVAGDVGRETVRSLARRPWRSQVIDTYPERREMSRGMVLAAAIALARRWRRTLPGGRVGVVLTPGLGATVANLALVLAGKVPVNLNFTAGAAGVASALRQAGVTHVVSASALRERLEGFPWPKDGCVDVKAEIGAAGGGPAMLVWLALAWLLPGGWLASLLGLPREGGDREAALLFTSGTAGEPKGVPLSHRNLLANVAQVGETGLIRPDDRLLGCLPVFHAFGFTVKLWLPLLRGAVLVTYPTPLEPRRLAEVIAAERVTVLASTPTFLRGLAAHSETGQLRTLRKVIAGAEKLPADLAALFLGRFQIRVLEGYGLTETSPVVAVNLPDPPRAFAGSNLQEGGRAGSVGRLLPGLAARLLDPGTGERVPQSATGVLQLRGANVFAGYLGDPPGPGAVRDGWLTTGDLARFDAQGFLYIEGRLARFSKIAGEMVPHAWLEERIVAALGLGGGETSVVAVVGVPDAERGERLVVLATVPIDAETLRCGLGAAGVTNLWIPREVVQVAQLPVLATGKLDLRMVQAMALRGAGGRVQ